MAFSEAELVVLALIFISTLIFLLLERRNNTFTAKNTKKKRKGRKRVTHQRHCQDHQHRTRRGPDENDDDEPYNPRGTILWWDFVMLLAVNSPWLKVWRLIPFHLRFINTHKIYFARFFASFETSRIKKTYKTSKALLLKNISTFYFSRIMWREIFGHVAVHKRLLTRPTEYILSRNFQN